MHHFVSPQIQGIRLQLMIGLAHGLVAAHWQPTPQLEGPVIGL